MVDGLVMQKIDALSRCVARIEQKRPTPLLMLEQDIDAQDIISVNLERPFSNALTLQ